MRFFIPASRDIKFVYIMWGLSEVGAKFTICNMASMNMRLISLSMNDMIAIMTLLVKLHGLLLMSTIIKKRKQYKQSLIYSYLAREKLFKN